MGPAQLAKITKVGLSHAFSAWDLGVPRSGHAYWPLQNQLKFTIAEGVVVRDVEGDLVVLNTLTEEYYGLAGVGAEVWKLITSDRDPTECATWLAAEYEAPLEVIQKDVSDLIAHLVSAGILLRNES